MGPAWTCGFCTFLAAEPVFTATPVRGWDSGFLNWPEGTFFSWLGLEGLPPSPLGLRLRAWPFVERG